MKNLYGSCGNSIGVEQLTLTFIYGAVTDKSVWINELSKDGEGQRSLA